MFTKFFSIDLLFKIFCPSCRIINQNGSEFMNMAVKLKGENAFLLVLQINYSKYKIEILIKAIMKSDGTSQYWIAKKAARKSEGQQHAHKKSLYLNVVTIKSNKKLYKISKVKQARKLNRKIL